MRLMIDAHLDLAWNALSFNRDLTLEVDALNRHQQHMTDVRCRGRATTTLPELRRARVGLCVATLLARGGPEQPLQPGYNRTDLDHDNQTIAYAVAQGQWSYYQLLEQQGHVRMVRTAEQLRAHWHGWAEAAETKEPIGYILSMEGADPVVDVGQLEAYWNQGLRAIGPVHYGRGHYGYGTGTSGPLGRRGVELLREMQRLGMILDVTHLCDTCFFEALDCFEGPVLASHHNCRALVPGDRQLSDEQIKLLLQRDAVIGAALDAWMLRPGWERGISTPEGLTLEAVADHTDHICQLAGSTRHVALGTDLDGGFGTEQTPSDLRTIADVHRLEDIYRDRGYSPSDIDGIFHGNWIRFFRDALPDA